MSKKKKLSRSKTSERIIFKKLRHDRSMTRLFEDLLYLDDNNRENGTGEIFTQYGKKVVRKAINNCKPANTSLFMFKEPVTTKWPDISFDSENDDSFLIDYIKYSQEDEDRYNEFMNEIIDMYCDDAKEQDAEIKAE